MSDKIDAGEYLTELLKKQSRDAFSWAHATTLALKQYTDTDVDQEYLHTIFANAMMSMHDSIYNNGLEALKSTNAKLVELISEALTPVPVNSVAEFRDWEKRASQVLAEIEGSGK